MNRIQTGQASQSGQADHTSQEVQPDQPGWAGQPRQPGWAGQAERAGKAGQAERAERANGAGRDPDGAATEIRRAGPADLAALSDFFAGLSLQTRFLRFFAPVAPAPAVIRRLAGGAGTTDAVVALRGGVIVGHAMAVDHPGTRGEPVTEIGVVVADAWQSRGVGSALTRTLISRAHARGVTALTMDVMHGNRQVLAMIASHWTLSGTRRSADCVTVQVPLPPYREQPRGRPLPQCRERPGASAPGPAPRHLRGGAVPGVPAPGPGPPARDTGLAPSVVRPGAPRAGRSACQKLK